MLATHRKQRRGRLHEQRGAALAELAIVMPLLLLLILGMLDFGRLFTNWIDQTHLANLGARLAAVDYCPDPTQAPPVGDCGWAAKGCPVAGAPQNDCLAWYVGQRADLPDVKSGHGANDYVTAQNAAQVCVWYPDASYSGSPTSCTSTCGASPAVTPRPGDRVEVTVVGVYHWLKYLTNRANLATTRLVGKATMRLETPPSTTALAATGCYPAAPAGT